MPAASPRRGTRWRFGSPKNADEPDTLDPDHIADAAFYLTRQPKSAWTFELDLRPYAETW